MGKKKRIKEQKKKEDFRAVVPDFPTFENSDPNDPEEFALPALVGLPGQQGAPLTLPVKILRLISKRLWDCGLRYHPELRTIKYRKPFGAQSLWSAGTWVPIDEEDPEPVTLSQAQKLKVLRGLGFNTSDLEKIPDDQDDSVDFILKDGSRVPMTKADAARYASARKSVRMYENRTSKDSTGEGT